MEHAYFEIFPTDTIRGQGTGLYAWRFYNEGGLLIAASEGVGFETKEDAVTAIKRFCATVVDIAVDTGKAGVWAKSPPVVFKPVVMAV